MKFGYLTQLQAPRPWPKDVDYKVHWEALEQGVLAEACGFDYFWVTEHHFYEEIAHISAPEILLTALAMRTSRIRIGHAVVVLSCNDPIRVAERAATLDIFSNGRLELGTGRGAAAYHTEAFGMTSAQALESWPEAMEVICSLFKHDKFPGHEGKYYKYPARHLVPKPVQKPHPPLWCSASSPATFTKAAEKGLGALGFVNAPPETLQPAIDAYRETQATADPKNFFGAYPNFQIAGVVHAFCDHDDAYAASVGGAATRWYFGDNDTPINAIRFAEQFDKTKFAKAASYTDDQLRENAMMAAGDPDSCCRTIERWQKAGVDQLMLIMQAGKTTHDQVKRSMELFGEKVLPRFKS
jgi:alkanesulfonate monooxygenase SsuD/methylene tetrahydromethanopterin reductase-like flavin-dependent oxidoreductase (luciferase family)